MRSHGVVIMRLVPDHARRVCGGYACRVPTRGDNYTCQLVHKLPVVQIVIRYPNYITISYILYPIPSLLEENLLLVGHPGHHLPEGGDKRSHTRTDQPTAERVAGRELVQDRRQDREQRDEQGLLNRCRLDLGEAPTGERDLPRMMGMGEREGEVGMRWG
jgi:hypothetical protein